MKVFRTVAMAVCLVVCLWAHGGVLIWNKQAGPLVVTLFSAEAPIRTGHADLSVLVQKSGDPNPVLDADVEFAVSKPNVLPIRVLATHSQASNKLLYETTINIPEAGDWDLQVRVKSAVVAGSASGPLKVLPAQPPLEAYWPYFAVVPMAILLFVLNQWLTRPSVRKRR